MGSRVFGRTFTFPGSYVDPNDYFADLAGTYALEAGGNINIWGTDNTKLQSFNATSMTISTVPEPSALLLGGLGLLTLRRRRSAL